MFDSGCFPHLIALASRPEVAQTAMRILHFLTASEDVCANLRPATAVSLFRTAFQAANTSNDPIMQELANPILYRLLAEENSRNHLLNAYPPIDRRTIEFLDTQLAKSTFLFFPDKTPWEIEVLQFYVINLLPLVAFTWGLGRGGWSSFSRKDGIGKTWLSATFKAGALSTCGATLFWIFNEANHWLLRKTVPSSGDSPDNKQLQTLQTLTVASVPAQLLVMYMILNRFPYSLLPGLGFARDSLVVLTFGELYWYFHWRNELRLRNQT